MKAQGKNTPAFKQNRFRGGGNKWLFPQEKATWHDPNVNQ
jgi:hypothetical protein